MNNFKKHIIASTSLVKEALVKINDLVDKNHLTLFVIDDENKLIGTITDGDVRRGLLNGLSLEDSVTKFMRDNFRFLPEDKINPESLAEFEKQQIFLIPILNEDKEVVKILDLSREKAFLPLDVVIMAGGKGMRLRPLTKTLPKPLLEVGGVPIIERNVNRLQTYGIQNIHITVNYLGEIIEEYFKKTDIQIVREKSFMGTLGAISLVQAFQHDTVLIMNSDLLTNIDYADFFAYFKSTDADMLIASIPYEVNVPYAVLEDKDGKVVSLKEKPTYTYYSNAGIYLVKAELLDLVPKEKKYDATDLIEHLIDNGRSVVSYPLRAYWLDIGNHKDYSRAQEDVKHIQF